MSRFYRCRVCHGTFERETMKGRKPVACPKHRPESRRRVDRRKKRANYASGGPARRPQCCVDASMQCAQHRQWKTFKYEWRRKVVNPRSLQILADFTEALGADGFHITSN
jgi:hypothetical protein